MIGVVDLDTGWDDTMDTKDVSDADWEGFMGSGDTDAFGFFLPDVGEDGVLLSWSVKSSFSIFIPKSIVSSIFVCSSFVLEAIYRPPSDHSRGQLQHPCMCVCYFPTEMDTFSKYVQAF
jgi:hypothetical protein